MIESLQHWFLAVPKWATLPLLFVLVVVNFHLWSSIAGDMIHDWRVRRYRRRQRKNGERSS